jgi:hypothetical protein
VKGFLLFLVLLGAGVALGYTHYLSPDARHRRAASAFVAQVRMDELTWSSTMVAYRIELQKGKVTATELGCMQKLTIRDFNDELAKLLQRKLSRHDIQVAANFYHSSAGRKYSDMVLRAISTNFPSIELEFEGEEPSLFMEEILELDAYRNSLKSRNATDPFQVSFDLGIEPEMAQFERAQRRKCMPASKA